MKKLIIALAATAMTCSAASAQQSIFNNPDNRAYFGVRVGADISCPGDVKVGNIGLDMFGNGAGVEFGAIYNMPVIANFYVEPGVKLFYDTYSFSKEFMDKASIRKFGMRIPVMAGYHFDFTDDIKVSIFTGPEFEIGFSGKEHISEGGVSESGSIYGEYGDMQRLNLLWGIGAGISWQKFYFGVNGGIGLLNMYKKSDIKFHENRVTFSLGYNF